jgi:hypothetical protein
LAPPPGNAPGDFRVPYALVRYRLQTEQTRLSVDGVPLQWGRDYVTALALPPPKELHWRLIVLDGAALEVDAAAERAFAAALQAHEGLLLACRPSTPFKGLEFARARGLHGRIGMPESLPQALSRAIIHLTPSGQTHLGISDGTARALSTIHDVVYVPRTLEEPVACCNLLGVVAGTGPAPDKEVTILSAHFDHLDPNDQVTYPGADDDASGCAVALEVGRRLAASPPRHSVAILLCSGEELGLLGARAFLASDRPLAHTIRADLNLDMVGRSDAGGLAFMPSNGEGPMTSLAAEGRVIAHRMGLPLRSEKPGLWLRGDHLPFAEKGIPAAFLTSGLHADYHQPTDTPGKLSQSQMVTAADFAEQVMRVVADADSAPRPVAEPEWRTWTWPVR